MLTLARVPCTAVALRRRAADNALAGKDPSIQLSVVYGVMTSGGSEYREKLAAQAETWAAGLAAQGRSFAVAGRGYAALHAAGLIVESRCPDGRSGQACKEGRILEEGYKRGADWLMVLGEDHYVNTAELEAELRQRTNASGSAVPLVLGLLGCGKGGGEAWGYCPEVDRLGGICGGAGYAFNRAALRALMAGGAEALRAEFGTEWMPGDMASSCAVRRRAIRLEDVSLGDANRNDREADFRELLARGMLTFHYVSPAVMRWLHASVQKRPVAEVRALQQAAFDGGCCCQEDLVLRLCQEKVRESLEAEDRPAAELDRRFDFSREMT